MARPQSSTPAASNPGNASAVPTPSSSSGGAAGVAATHLFLSSIALCSATLLPQILALLTQASAASAVAPTAFAQLQTLCTRLDDEACAEEEMDARWSGVRRARKEQRLSVVCEADNVQLQLPSPPTPLRPGTPAHVAARTLVLVDLLGAPGFPTSSSSTASSQDLWQAVQEGERKQASHAEAKRDQGWMEAVNALGWRPLHSFTRAGVRFLLRDEGAKGHFEVLVFRLSLPASTSTEQPPSSTYIIQAKVLHSLVPIPAPSAPGAAFEPASSAASPPAVPPSAVEIQAALERGMHELDALQERCKGLLVFERDVE